MSKIRGRAAVAAAVAAAGLAPLAVTIHRSGRHTGVQPGPAQRRIAVRVLPVLPESRRGEGPGDQRGARPQVCRPARALRCHDQQHAGQRGAGPRLGVLHSGGSADPRELRPAAHGAQRVLRVTLSVRGAGRRAVLSERSEFDGAPQQPRVSSPILLIDEEMKDGAVVPDRPPPPAAPTSAGRVRSKSRTLTTPPLPARLEQGPDVSAGGSACGTGLRVVDGSGVERIAHSGPLRATRSRRCFPMAARRRRPTEHTGRRRALIACQPVGSAGSSAAGMSPTWVRKSAMFQ
jgi:hypothetical protein